MGGTSGEGTNHGDAVRRDFKEVHALKNEQSVFWAIRLGEAGDEGGAGNYPF